MDLIQNYFPELSEEQIGLFNKLQELYPEWNEKINVISRKDIDELNIRHVLHSLAIAKYTKFCAGTKIIDVGTGGGFPGIPLAIYFPDCEFHLVDSIGKKIKVVNTIAQELGLKNVKAQQTRSENVKGKYDFVVSRAVTAFPRFVSLTRHLVSDVNKNAVSNGILYLKGGEFEDEIKPFNKRISVLELTDYYAEEFFETKKLIHLTF
ncbi:16S rRNA (guanine(527)-N(7))-methyltransferase RsmG [Saccharicrinis fermentans]|uniref:Ribosomal RNA small subunit methyltransferase G n=1 Tax=Saccharicrinis fermentans DSM 9555 = JCM 21142 TaxID=869213 RepID=W7YDI3_9BACT|nr:16S rRNA (guanine(527)-N(7))-methyltransferase RsmG [Saccharicrinis fermentans]GAF02546.1 ribosomal RNA small subunit methyltransferase G [Saccharicrinis fermentans DSM 9555 = JCM 21142]